MTHLRQTLVGTALEPMDPPRELKVLTRVPEKYLLVDTETGEIYQGLASSSDKGLQWARRCSDAGLVQDLCARALLPAEAPLNTHSAKAAALTLNQ